VIGRLRTRTPTALKIALALLRANLGASFVGMSNATLTHTENICRAGL
jgi:hypothetical protein